MFLHLVVADSYRPASDVEKVKATTSTRFILSPAARLTLVTGSRESVVLVGECPE